MKKKEPKQKTYSDNNYFDNIVKKDQEKKEEKKKKQKEKKEKKANDKNSLKINEGKKPGWFSLRRKKENKKSLVKKSETPSMEKSTLDILDSISPDVFSEHESYIKTAEDRYSISSFLEIYPRRLHTGIFERLYSGGDIDTKIVIRRGKNSEDARLLTNRIKQLNTMYEFAQKNFDEQRQREIATELRDVHRLLDGMSNGSDYIFRTWIGAKFSGPTLKGTLTLFKKVQKHFVAKGALNSQKSRLRIAYGRQSEYFRKIMPTSEMNTRIFYKNPKKAKLGMMLENSLLDIEQSEYRTMNVDGVKTLNFLNNCNFPYIGGIPLGRNRHSMSTVFMDLFAGPPVANNYNLGIFGEPGSGKSATAKAIVNRMYGMRGVHTAAIDPNGELKGLANRIPGSKIISFDDAIPFTINPFEMFPEVFENERGEKYEALPLSIKINRLTDLYGVIYISLYKTPISARQLALLSKATAYMYYRKGITVDKDSIYQEDSITSRGDGSEEYIQNRLKYFPTFTELYLTVAYLFSKTYPDDVKDLKLFLSPVLGGMEKIKKQPNADEILAFMNECAEMECITKDDIEQDLKMPGSISYFDGQTDIESYYCGEDEDDISLKDSPLVVFDMKNIRDNSTLLPIAMFIATDYIRETFLKKAIRQQKIVYIDEAWRMLRTTAGYAASFLEALIREARKFNAGVLLCSQNFQDFYLGGDVGRSIFQNVPMVLLMQQSPATINHICEVFSLDDGIRNVLMNLQNSPGCGVLKTPNNIVSIHVEIAEEEWTFIDTNPNTTRNTEWTQEAS